MGFYLCVSEPKKNCNFFIGHRNQFQNNAIKSEDAEFELLVIKKRSCPSAIIIMNLFIYLTGEGCV